MSFSGIEPSLTVSNRFPEVQIKSHLLWPIEQLESTYPELVLANNMDEYSCIMSWSRWSSSSIVEEIPASDAEIPFKHLIFGPVLQ